MYKLLVSIFFPQTIGLTCTHIYQHKYINIRYTLSVSSKDQYIVQHQDHLPWISPTCWQLAFTPCADVLSLSLYAVMIA